LIAVRTEKLWLLSHRFQPNKATKAVKAIQMDLGAIDFREVGFSCMPIS
jgi:hypothetical protein